MNDTKPLQITAQESLYKDFKMKPIFLKVLTSYFLQLDFSIASYTKAEQLENMKEENLFIFHCMKCRSYKFYLNYLSLI